MSNPTIQSIDSPHPTFFSSVSTLDPMEDPFQSQLGFSKTTIGLVLQSEHCDETEEIATDIEHILEVTDLSKSSEIQPGEHLDPSCYIADIYVECVTRGVDLAAHGTAKLAIFEHKTGSGTIVLLKRESPEVWRQTSLVKLHKDIEELRIMVTFGEWVDLTHIQFTKDELALESHGARIDKMFIPEGVSPELKLSFAITEIPQEEFRGEAISQDELFQIARGLMTCGVESCQRFEDMGNLADIEKAISALQLAARLTPDDRGEKSAWLDYIGIVFRRRFERTGNPLDISDAISLQQRAIQLTPNDDVDLFIYLSNLGTSFMRRFEHLGALPDISNAISYLQRAIQLAPYGHAHLPFQLNSLGISLRLRFEHNDDLKDVSEAISFQQRAVRLTPDGDPNKLVWLCNLGGSFMRRFKHTGDLPDIAEAILLQQKAVQLTPTGHIDMAMRLNNLGLSFLHRFERNGDLFDISESISLQQRAVQLTPNDDIIMLSVINNLGSSLLCRFERTGDLSDITDAITSQRQALKLTPHGHVSIPIRQTNLGLSLNSRFRYTGNINDITEAISLQKQAVQLAPDGHAEMALHLNNLGVSFMSRFEHGGDLSDISEAISLHHKAVQITPNGHTEFPSRLNNLGQSLMRRFERTGNLQDISEAISFQKLAVKLAPNGHSEMSRWLNGLGVSFMCRFERTGELPDIAEAISLKQQAVQLTPHDDFEMASRLTNLGNSFSARFEYTDNLSDISEAISCQQKAVQLTPNEHAYMALYLDNLGCSLKRRFERNGDIDDISESITLCQRAVQLTPIDHTDKPKRLTHLGVSFWRRFEHTNNLIDIAKAISFQEQAVQLAPDGDILMSLLLNNLGLSFLSRFEHNNELHDIYEAISFQQRAVQLTPDGDANMPLWMNNLGVSFLHRFERTGDLSDIMEAISLQQRVVQITPDGHAQLTGWLNNLALSYAFRFESTQDIHDVQKAASIYQQSTSTFGPPAYRLTAARKWAQISITHNLPHTLKAFGTAIDFMSQVAGIHRTIEQRHTDLGDISQLTTVAASVAFAQGESEKALEWLEQGRCLIWSQLNQLRTPVDTLHEHDEQLAQRFLDISGALESSGSRGGSGSLGVDAPMSHKMSLQNEAHTHIKLAHEWTELLDEIRGVPGFHDFLRPPQASELLNNLPHNGPIVLINIHETRCDALALIPGSDMPIHIPLDKFTYKQASDLKKRLRNLLLSKRVRMREVHRAGHPVKPRNIEKQSDMYLVLKELWIHVVRPILDGLAFSDRAPPELRRIWWCPTGPLAFLPLHAAGIYDPNERPLPGSCISDLAVSSYTPTVSALLEKLKRSSDTENLELSPISLLIVSQPKTPGCTPLPGTTKETRLISKTVGTDNVKYLSLEGEAATIGRVKQEMESYRSVHFACHANQNIEKPLKSGFCLHDGRLELADIMKQKIAHCDLAFLSACQTSAGDEKLSEEAVHLAAGMLAVGYRGVVATMWSISDNYGPMVAESFYKYLVEKGTSQEKPRPDSASSAYALHHAIQNIREEVGDTEQGLLMWVPYVHFGF